MLGYNVPTEDDVQAFRAIVGPEGVLHDAGESGPDLSTYNRDWLGHYEGKSRVVLRPSDTSQVAEILQYCNKRR